MYMKIDKNANDTSKIIRQELKLLHILYNKIFSIKNLALIPTYIYHEIWLHIVIYTYILEALRNFKTKILAYSSIENFTKPFKEFYKN